MPITDTYLIKVATLGRILGRDPRGLRSYFRKRCFRTMYKGRTWYVRKVDAIDFVKVAYPNNPEYVDTIINIY